MMNKPSLAGTLMCGQIARSLALVMTTSQCIAALIACFVLSEAAALQSGRHLSPSLPRTERYRSPTRRPFSPPASAIYHSLRTRRICGRRCVWMRHGRLEAPKIMSTKWNRWDWMKKPSTVPVARATEVPTQLYFCRLIQLCSSNNFWRYWTIRRSSGNMKNLRSHLLMRNKIWVAPSIKSPNHITFSRHKRLSPFPHFISSAVVICHVSRYIMHKCCLFYCWFQIGWSIWYGGSEGSDALLFSLISLPVGHFCLHILSCPSLLWKVSCLFSMMTISSSKNIFWKRLLSKSVQAWSLFKSKAWVEAYNGLDSLEEAAFFYSLSPFPVIFVILVNTQLYDKELT